MSSDLWHFGSAERRAHLAAVLERWRGTRFFPHMAEPGVGVDCVRLVAAVLGACGVPMPAEWPRYAVRGGGPDVLARLEAGIRAVRGMTQVWARGSAADRLPLLMPGDVLVFSTGEAGHHLGIYGGGGDFWHVQWRGQVAPASLAEARTQAALRAVYRMKEAEA